MGLTERSSHKPNELSGGEKQRVAVARALINNPSVILADEPSGSLDTHNKDELHQLFFDLRDKFEQTFVIVTHDRGLNDIILDPGFGFGKTLDHNYELLSHLEEFKIFELPILVGLSRKSMITKLLDIPTTEALNGTTVANTIALMTQARDKNGLPLTSDSLISVAVEYFNDKKDLDTKAKTYFYAGRVNQDMQNAKQAMEYFLKAADFLEDSKDYKLKYLIYYYLGDLYLNEGLFDSALKSNRQAFYYSQLLNNKGYMAYALRSIAFAYSGKKEHRNALKYYFKVLNILPKSDVSALAILFNEMGIQYNHLKDYSLALKTVNKAISINQDSAKLLYNYFVKAEIYSNTHQYDSASYFYNKTTHSLDLYTKTESYNKLSKLERNRGDINKALFYNDSYLNYRDSIESKLHGK